MFRRAAALTLVILFASALNLLAAEHDGTGKDAAPLAGAADRAAADLTPATGLWTVPESAKRPSLLPALYGTYGALQIMDVMSTRRALAAGAHEANPVMRSGGLGRMIAVKAAGSAATMFFVERAWKKNRVGAIVLMAAINGVSAAVVAHNHHNALR